MSVTTKTSEDTSVSSQAHGDLTNHQPSRKMEISSKSSSEVLPLLFANQCVETSRNENVKEMYSGISPETLPDLGGLHSKSCEETSNTVKLIVENNFLMDEVSLIKTRSGMGSSAASIFDIRSNLPDRKEALHLLSERNRTTNNKINSVNAIFTSNDINIEFVHIWTVVVDLYRAAILYGYQIKINNLRTEMIRTWISLSTLCLSLPEVKIVKIPEQPGNQGCSSAFNISRWMKVIKYKLAAFASWAKGSDVLPISPFSMPDNPSILLGKRFTRFMKLNQALDASSKGFWYMSLVDTLCRGVKKGAPRATDSDCLVNCYETFLLFTTPKEKPVYRNIDVDDMTSEVIRSVTEVIGDALFIPEYTHCPSFSSCTENPLFKGGHVKVVKEQVPSLPVDKEYEVYAKYGLAYNPQPIKHFNPTEFDDPIVNRPFDTVCSDKAVEKFGDVQSIKYLEIDINPLNIGTDLDIDSLCKICLDDPSLIRAVALKEALKVRGITTPCALETWLLKPLQKFLAKRLLDFDVFAVTGQPLNSGHLERAFRMLLPDQVFVSGDYDNATNNMISHYTRIAVETVCDLLGCSELYKMVAVRSLCDCIVEVKEVIGLGKTKKTLITQGIQREAQPMGKILSFTILCIVNFAVCRKALELDQGQSIHITRFPGLINGDDCCFPISNFDHWTGCSAMVGLFNSIGKTFTSRKFVEMNSRTFLVDAVEYEDGLILNPRFKEVPFVNFGLMKGIVRSQSNENTVMENEKRELIEAVSRIGWCHSELIRGFEPFFNELDFLFKNYHNKYLLSPHLNGIPYYIPFWLGGLGMSPGYQPEKLISVEQRQICSWIYQSYDKLKPKSICLEKTCLINSIIERCLQGLCKRFDIPDIHPFQNLEGESLEEYNFEYENTVVYNHLIEKVWRSSPIQEFFVEISDNFVRQSARIGAKKLYHNADIWKRGFNFISKSADYKVLNWHKIWHQKQTGVKPIVSTNHSFKNESLVNSLTI